MTWWRHKTQIINLNSFSSITFVDDDGCGSSLILFYRGSSRTIHLSFPTGPYSNKYERAKDEIMELTSRL